MINLVIFGAPGSGKGTQSDKIVEKYGFKHISTGDVLRREIKNETELGFTAKQYIDKGQLIPDSLMIDILAHVYDSMCPCKGVIFDGFPRTIAQAESLSKLLKARDTDVSAMIDLEVPDKMLIERLVMRGKTSGRADDNEETIGKRLEVYKNQTSPLIAWYQKAGKYCHVNGVGEVDAIFEDICKIIDRL
jgi:adenylate kinase